VQAIPSSNGIRVARPLDPEQPAVLLLPAIAGINPYIASRAETLAGQGYNVLALDYFWREGQAPDISTPEKIGAAVAALDDRQVAADIDAALDWLSAQGIAASRVATLGFCIGGTYSILAAARASLGCAIDYYGQLQLPESASKPVSPTRVAATLRCPLLCHYGDWDRLVSAKDIAGFVQNLREGQRPYELLTFQGAPHAFDEFHRPQVFRPVASHQAWQASLRFLDWHLRGCQQPAH